VDFRYDDEQAALREAVSGLLGRAYGPSGEQRRAVTAADPGFDEKTWARLAEMGVLGLPFAEDDGGMGAGPVEVGIVTEEIGRVLAPEPFVEVVVLAGGLVAALGTGAQRAEVLSAIAEGGCVAAFAHAEPGTRWSASAAGVTATEDGGTWQLSGAK
jgi:alkylation response protein AidB-like acyl-CoA dehydrogenase